LLATIIAGVILLVSGFLRLGTYVKHIPYPVTVGFTAGIAIIILASQIKDLLGLTLLGQEPGEIVPKLEVLGQAITTANPAAIQVALFTIAIIAGVKRFLPRWPDMLIAVVCAAGVSALLHLPVATIGSRFGEMPHGLPFPSFPAITMVKITEILPDAFAFAFLCAIESLLSAVVADTMTGRKHRSNCELVAQGIANIASGLFGGICVTGLIARTGTNVRAGAQSPLAGMFHAVFLLLFMLIAASLARFIPLAALAALLAVVAWSMVEKEAFMRLLRCSRADALILLTTALLTVFRSLTEGIIARCAIAAFLFIKNKYRTLPAESRAPLGSGEDTQSRPSERSLADL
jgi:sulfate permease, SulP family